MAHKKGQGSTRNGRDSQSKRLGVKLFGGQSAISGNIIIRQRGTKYHPGTGVGLGKDHTIYAITDGVVTFTTKKNNKKFVSVLPIGGEAAVAPAPKKTSKATAKPVVAKEETKGRNPKTGKDATAKTQEDTPKVETSNAAVAKEETKGRNPKTGKENEAVAKETAAPAPKAAAKKSGKADDLKKIEGIGPKIAETLNNAGIVTFADLAKSSPEKISEIIADVRGNHVTDTWPKQAEMAADGKWDELKKWQDELDGGKA